MLHALISFFGALALFFMQPLLGKALTPRFGGGAQVWITCMLFFQVALLAGYAYAHGLIRWVKPAHQKMVHSALLLAAVGWIAVQWLRTGHPLMASPPDLLLIAKAPVRHLLWTLVATAALPMLVLCSVSPLVQAWFSRSHPGDSPYRLYAMSNAGSFVGLFGFPFVAERWIPTSVQGKGVSILFVGVVIGLACLAVRDDRASDSRIHPGSAPSGAVETPFRAWLLPAAAGNLVLMAATNTLSTDIASVPLLWILPLALYLLTFILIFEGRWASRAWVPGASVLAYVSSLILFIVAADRQSPNLIILACSGQTFFGCLVCHGYLYALRPGPTRLTSYYLAMALGGVLGGVAVALLAPLLFDRIYEVSIGAMVVAFIGLLWLKRSSGNHANWQAVLPVLCLTAGGLQLWAQARMNWYFYRDFYGVLQVEDRRGRRALIHGRTIHGIWDPATPGKPLSYYAPEGGMGRALLLQMNLKHSVRVGVVGLGQGTLAMYGRPGDAYSFYEISPKVIRLSGLAPQIFPSLKWSPARVEVLEGDGRLVLEQELTSKGSKGFDLLVLDAFSADAVPWHLLTLEAFELYFRHLAPDGILAVHVSNPLPLHRVVISNAKALSLYGALVVHNVTKQEQEQGLATSKVVLLSRSREVINQPILLEKAIVGFGPKIFQGPIANRPPMLSSGRPWRDDRNSLSELLFEIRMAN